MSAVAASYALFVVRGIWMMRAPERLRERWVKAVPHVVDTILLASAIAMLVVLRLDPLNAPWLVAKIVGLVAYIGIGTIALKRGRTHRTRVAAWIAAQLVFFYIAGVAVTKNPWPLG
jgi:uncharacterized membrane protein SirB2